MTPTGLGAGPQNVFDGNAATTYPDGSGGTVPAFLNAHPDVNAVTARDEGFIFLDDSFGARSEHEQAQDMIHESIVHVANNRTDIEFAPAGSADPRTDGSHKINEIIKKNCNRLRP